MKHPFLTAFLLTLYWILFVPLAPAQTRVAKEQIEDAFLLKTGGAVYGTLTAATSSIEAATVSLLDSQSIFRLSVDGAFSAIRSNKDLLLDPTNQGTAGARIVPATVIQFLEFMGDKIRFFGHAYSIGVSPYAIDITSDKHIKFHSDTAPNLMTVWGDEGDVDIKRHLTAGGDISAGGTFTFRDDVTGDKLILYGAQYKLGISEDTLDFFSDRDFAWHGDGASDRMRFNADTGRLTLTGPLKLPVYSTLPGGEPGDLIFYDHQTDNNQDGVYVYTASGWQKL